MSILSDLFRPVLSDKTILKYNKKGLLITTPIPKNQIQPNSVDITLGNTWRKLEPNIDAYAYPWLNHSRDTGAITTDPYYNRYVDTKKEIEYDKGTFSKIPYANDEYHCTDMEYYILKPHEFVLMASNEVLNIPNGILCFVQGRSSIARLGIQTEQAGLVDAGFIGTITFEMFNQTNTNIILYKGMRIAQLYFFKAQHAMFPYGSKEKGSKYQTQIEATGSRIHMDFVRK